MPRIVLALAVWLVAAGAAVADVAPFDEAAAEAAQDRIEAQEKQDQQACDKLKGNARDVCQATAKGRAKVAKAKLEARLHPGLEAEQDVKNVKAEADYAVAKKRCAAAQGQARDACLQQAGNAREAAIRQAKVEKVESMREARAQAQRKAARAASAAARPRGSSMPTRAETPSVRNLGLDQPGQLRQRLLPAEVAHLDRDHIGDAFLHDGHVGAAGHRPQRNGGAHLARQLGIVEAVGVDDPLAGHQLEVLAAERVAVTAGEIGERHPERAAHLRVHLVHLAGEAVGRQPFRHRIRIEESAVDALGLGAQYAVEPDGASSHGNSLSLSSEG